MKYVVLAAGIMIGGVLLFGQLLNLDWNTSRWVCGMMLFSLSLFVFFRSADKVFTMPLCLGVAFFAWWPAFDYWASLPVHPSHWYPGHTIRFVLLLLIVVFGYRIGRFLDKL